MEPKLSNGWRFTADHPASKHGIPVLVSPDGNAHSDSDLLTTAQVAAIYGISGSGVLKLITRETLHAERYSGVWLIRASDVLKAVDRKPGPPPGTHRSQ